MHLQSSKSGNNFVPMSARFFKCLSTFVLYISISFTAIASGSTIDVLNMINQKDNELAVLEEEQEPYVSVKEVSKLLTDRLPFEMQRGKKSYYT